MNFGLGWKRSHENSPRRSAFGSIARASGDLPLAFAIYGDEVDANVLDQGNSSTCVLNAKATCVQIVTGGPLISRLAGYGMARAMGGEDRHRLTDDGCVPADAVAASSQYGECLEADWPFDLARVNDMPPWDIISRASAYRITAWERLSPYGLGDELCRVLVARQPVMYGQLVGPGYQTLAPGAVYTSPEQNGGGHMQTICGYRPSLAMPGFRDFRVQNSWSRSWCQGGFSWVSEAVLLDPSSSDFYALQAAPTGIT